ncbi:hypothetical protein CEV33_3555 [Brucella grignonensis]|uniref:Uncharacterized protein n=1 Tax=Brucella grignonensis TaxID=94627 RepID=A0A256EYT2_9HYPH|nr:hypothetical protein CEV33_3555 [Brucella grignonensis]
MFPLHSNVTPARDWDFLIFRDVPAPRMVDVLDEVRPGLPDEEVPLLVEKNPEPKPAVEQWPTVLREKWL